MKRNSRTLENGLDLASDSYLRETSWSGLNKKRKLYGNALTVNHTVASVENALLDSAEAGKTDNSVSSEDDQVCRSVSGASNSEILSFDMPGTVPGGAATATVICCPSTAFRSPQEKGQRSAVSPPDLLWFNPSDEAKVARAKQVFQAESVHSTGVPRCRSKQYASMAETLQSLLKEAKGGVLHASGPPGTGKTMTIKRVVQRCHEWTDGSLCPVKPAVIWVNCMSLFQPKLVFQRIVDGLDCAAAQSLQAHRKCPIMAPPIESKYPASSDYRAILRDLVFRRRPVKRRRSSGVFGMAVVVLDEIDALKTAKKDILMELLSMTTGSESRLIIIGISNSTNFLERALLPECSTVRVRLLVV
mmetsp:Transcript_28794/g.68713  ORF Transcript_28794/g.68713 Transcript_28794/m.68713 type:complete len:360 (-) Transcript_28794:878-1957(-)